MTWNLVWSAEQLGIGGVHFFILLIRCPGIVVTLIVGNRAVPVVSGLTPRV